MITKNISIGTLDIEPEAGKIWLNCPNCILRIKNVKFNKIEEKFSMIDINGQDAWMLPGSLNTEPIGDFLEKISNFILPKVFEMNIDDEKNFLDKLSLLIKEEVDKCQS